ncbi:hypothetical protein LTR85_009076 [Meristemomyces frigidus]|nr:hypothetical protein LTR85_009076 [Meristemomyces frigidus]
MFFATSAEEQSYESELAAKSQDQPHTVKVMFSGTNMRLAQRSMCGATVEVHTIDFPKGHRESIAEEMAAVKGIDYTYNFVGIDGSRPEVLAKYDNRRTPLFGWVIQQVPGQREIDQAVWLHVWKSPEREAHFKQTEVRTMSGFQNEVDDNGVKERVWPVEEFFEERLRQLGALRIAKEHYTLERFPHMY